MINLKKLDYFNTPVKLRFNGFESHYTNIGLLFSLIIFFVFLFVTYSFGKEMFE